MITTSVAVDATNALVGMYVARLDRPWLETPFVFQGFEIRDRVEIDLLQSYCSTIYVDVHRGSLSEAEIRALASTRRGREASTATLRRKSREPGRIARWLVKLLLRFGVKPRSIVRRSAESAGYPVISFTSPTCRLNTTSGIPKTNVPST